MSDDIRLDYEEAASILALSPRAASALLRLCIQKLCKELGESGKNIDNDISALVGKGLSVEIQRALDTVRVIGNESVHPGELDLRDNLPIATALFGLLNLIIDRLISEPKRIKELYADLPQTKLDGIVARDKNYKQRDQIPPDT